VSARVLVVEDAPVLRRLLEEALTEEGFEVAAVPTGRQALELLDREGPPHVLILDLHLPDMPGGRLLENIRTARGLRGLPVLCVSGVDDPGQVPPGVALLPKPFDLDTLASRVRELAGRPVL
jgi:DNA-binding response OmpR family regulator